MEEKESEIIAEEFNKYFKNINQLSLIQQNIIKLKKEALDNDKEAIRKCIFK